MTFLCAFLALIIELLAGYPKWLGNALGHPVEWIGALVSRIDKTLNLERHLPGRRKLLGILGLAVLVAVILIIGVALHVIVFTALQGTSFYGQVIGLVVLGALASTLLAQRALYTHVAAVAQALEHDGLGRARLAVAKIVGRDTNALTESGVARAAIESLAENFSDGIVAPVFWLAIGGLPGGLMYKAVNTADSMIGYKTVRYKDFGWATARFDDLINLPASRLSAALLILAAGLKPGASARGSLKAVWRDARRHRSPNAGWPEAAVAGALALSLAGPRLYDGVQVNDVEMGQGGQRAARADDIRTALRLYWIADVLLIGLVGAVAVLAAYAF